MEFRRVLFRSTTPGDARRAPLPHPEIFAAVTTGQSLLLDDGKIRLRVLNCGDDFAETEVMVGGRLSNRKGVNVPDAILPVAALTEKDRSDFEAALNLGIAWMALSFIQRPDDIAEARTIARGRAALLDRNSAE